MPGRGGFEPATSIGAKETIMSTTSSPKPTLFGEGFLDDPYSVYRRFQSEAAIHHLDWGGGRDQWTIFSYSGVSSALKDPRLSARRAHAFLLPLPESERAQFSELERVLLSHASATSSRNAA
jgi:hypothetical protein